MDSENESKWIICRTCLKPGTEMVKIFEDPAQNLAASIEECGGVVLDTTVDLPDKICTKCLTLLKAATKFRTTCQKTQKALYKQFCNEARDKEDPLELPPDFPVEFLKFKKKESQGGIIVEQAFVETNATAEEEIQDTNLIATDCYNLEYDQPQEISNETTGDSIITDEVGFELIKDEVKPSEYNEQEQDMVEYVLEIDGDQKEGNFKIISQVKSKNPPVNQVVMSTKPKRKYKSVQVYENADGHFECPKCDNVYVNKHKLILHLKMHNQSKPHECEICFKRFAQTPQLSRHMNTHTGQRPFQCTYCPASFADPSTRIKHIRTHTNERPYTCGVCHKSFTYSNVLKVHQMIHTGEKPYSCRHCGKKFSQAHHRKNHERTHTSFEN